LFFDNSTERSNPCRRRSSGLPVVVPEQPAEAPFDSTIAGAYYTASTRTQGLEETLAQLAYAVIDYRTWRWWVISAYMDAERAQNECVGCARLRGELRALREEAAKLTAALEEARRRGKRQAAPFSKGPPVEEPKPPGRRSGKLHGRAS
jgi:hypothetical protein